MFQLIASFYDYGASLLYTPVIKISKLETYFVLFVFNLCCKSEHELGN